MYSKRKHNISTSYNFLQAKYKDPQTRMLYSTSEEFSTIRNLPMDIIGGYLTLRKAAPT